jgi:hypothetical protein
MPGRRHLLDSLPEDSATPHNVEDLRLVTINLNRARPKVVGGRVQIYKFSWHVFSCLVFPALEIRFALPPIEKGASKSRALVVNSKLSGQVPQARS